MAKTPDRREERSGYPEKQPHDRDDARRSGAKKQPNPDAGGLDREPEQDGTHSEPD